MKFKIKFIFWVLLLVFTKGIYAQDPEFSQFYANPLYLNPAFAGSERCPRVILNFRDQWPSISGTFVTYAASYDQHVQGINGGLGILLLNDEAGKGTIGTTDASIMYSYYLPVSSSFSIRTGFQATFVQKRLNWEKLTFGDMIDPRYGFIYTTGEQRQEESVIYPDFSAGILGYTEMFYIGAAVNHLTQPDEGFLGVAKLPRKYTVHAGAKINLTKGGKGKPRRRGIENSLSPNILYQRQGEFEQINYGLYIHKDLFIAGLWFRQNFKNPDAVIILLGFQPKDVKFAYSYDLTVSKLTNATGGAHEFSLILQFPCKNKALKIRGLSCPHF